MLATTLLAQGTPMLGAGDEIGRSQQGNNNAWCQDQPLSWIRWDEADQGLIDFCARVLALRSAEPALSHRGWFEQDRGVWRLRWVTPEGHDMQFADWHRHDEHALACVVLHVPTPTAKARPWLWLGFNPHADARPFCLPEGDWALLLDSSAPDLCPNEGPAADTAARARTSARPLDGELPARSLVVLRHVD